MNNVIKHEQKDIAVQAQQPANIIQQAIAQGASVDQLERLWELQMKYDANEAKKQFNIAMAAFKTDPPRLVKDKHVQFANRSGDVTSYKHATLGNVCDIIGSALSKVGVSYRWETKQDGAAISVTCVLTHAAGHEEKTTLSAAPDQSGGKNSIQAVGSTVTYLQRYTLLAATGMATEDQDNDGQMPDESITEDQVANLASLIDEVRANTKAFLAFFKVDELAKLPAKRYDEAVTMLERKRK